MKTNKNAAYGQYVLWEMPGARWGSWEEDTSPSILGVGVDEGILLNSSPMPLALQMEKLYNDSLSLLTRCFKSIQNIHYHCFAI